MSVELCQFTPAEWDKHMHRCPQSPQFTVVGVVPDCSCGWWVGSSAIYHLQLSTSLWLKVGMWVYITCKRARVSSFPLSVKFTAEICAARVSSAWTPSDKLKTDVLGWLGKIRVNIRLYLPWKSLPWICISPLKWIVLCVELLQMNFYHHFHLRVRNHNGECLLDLIFAAGKLIVVDWCKSLEQRWAAAGLWCWINQRAIVVFQEHGLIFFFKELVAIFKLSLFIMSQIIFCLLSSSAILTAICIKWGRAGWTLSSGETSLIWKVICSRCISGLCSWFVHVAPRLNAGFSRAFSSDKPSTVRPELIQASYYVSVENLHSLQMISLLWNICWRLCISPESF